MARAAVGHAVDRDLRLFHRLQQSRLGLRGGAVDFVGQHQLREDRARAELELDVLRVEDADAGHIARQKIRRELDALERRADAAGDRLGQDRLANAGHVFDQDMPAAEQRNQHKLDFAALADYYTLNVAGYARSQFLNSLYLHERGCSLYGRIEDRQKRVYQPHKANI